MLVHRNTNDFCTLTLHPAGLLNLLVPTDFGGFLKIFYIQDIYNLKVEIVVLLVFFFYMDAFYFSFLPNTPAITPTTLWNRSGESGLLFMVTGKNF